MVGKFRTALGKFVTDFGLGGTNGLFELQRRQICEFLKGPFEGPLGQVSWTPKETGLKFSGDLLCL